MILVPVCILAALTALPTIRSATINRTALELTAHIGFEAEAAWQQVKSTDDYLSQVFLLSAQQS